ncbi:MAG: hypothetical protein K2I80_04475 [Ruminococcus sp.]|nr:hypothetical protein [Ruminococcus sp.]MDE5619765.1 hypothetical protein [Ruminococcus sp.]
MALATDRIAVITENLVDAGLDENKIAECLEMLDNQNFSALQKFLYDYRRKLLDSIHEYNKQIDCLDYFTYTLKKSMEVK